MKIALLGYGNVGRALHRLCIEKKEAFPFRITGIHTARHGTAYAARGMGRTPRFGPAAASVDEFLERSAPETLVELTTLNPFSGEPAIGHIRAAFARGLDVVTANKGPIAIAYRDLALEASRRGLLFRFESSVMDGSPVFNLFRALLPGVRVTGFTGVLNSTSKVVIQTMEEGGSLAEGIDRARDMGLTEADASFDIDGWDSAAKAAALANVLLDAGTTPQQVSTRGIGRLTTGRVQELAAQGKTVRLVSRGKAGPSGVSLRVRAEVLDRTNVLASAAGTSNLLLFHTDLMGTLGTVSINPGVEQTAYGVFADLIDIARTRPANPLR